MNPIGRFSISDLPSVYFDGCYRVLACLKETEESVADFPVFGAAMAAAPLDPAHWQEIDLQHFDGPIFDQGMSSSCVGQAIAGGLQLCYVQSGRPFTALDPYFVYGLINNGRDAGAMISSGLRAAKEFGDCPQGILPAGVMFRDQFPPEAFEKAKRYRLVNAYVCKNFEEICSAITLGFVTVLGIWVGTNFSQVDAEGVSPVPMGMGGGGHAILGVGLKKSARYGWLIKIRNSWGRRFGQGGYGYIHKGHFERMNPDAFAIQTILDVPEDNAPPPVPNA